jgi:hypothetical protein
MGMLKRQAGVLLVLSKEKTALRCQSKKLGQDNNDGPRSMNERSSFMQCCVKCRILFDCERKRDTRGAGRLVIQSFAPVSQRFDGDFLSTCSVIAERSPINVIAT